MANNSATGGYLTPTSAAPMDDDALLDFMHDVIVGITAMTDTLVRPAFQPNPPKRPGISVDWCAFWVSAEVPEAGYAFVKVDDDGLGSSSIRHESFSMRLSFYGPNSSRNSKIWRDGLEINQNREVMYLAGISYVESSGLTRLGDLVDQQWYKRVDITSTFNRELGRDYAVLPFLEAIGQIVTKTETIDWATGPEV